MGGGGGGGDAVLPEEQYYSKGVWGERCKLPHRGLGRSPCSRFATSKSQNILNIKTIETIHKQLLCRNLQ